jgi:hypothetical protein
MKANFNHNQLGSLGSVAGNTVRVFLGLILIIWLGVISVAAVGPVVKLAPGLTSREIQQALNGLPASGGEVVLSTGVYVIHDPIILKRDNQTLRGTGEATVLYLADHANCPVIILGEPVNNPTRLIRHLLVTGFFVDGNRRNQDRELWKTNGEGSEIRNNGITVQAVCDSLVENVTCARNRSGGLVTTLGVTRLTVRGLNAFDNEFDGLACYFTTNSLFTGLYLHDNPGAGISLDQAFNHNVISNAVLTGNDLGVFMRASRENKFNNISIRNSHHHGVFMAHTEEQTAQGWEPAPQTECVDNSFTNLDASHCGGAAFRVNDSTCTNNVLVSAKFAANRLGGLSESKPDLVTLR